MSEWIEQDHMDDNHLYVHLKNPELLDYRTMIFVCLVC